MSHWPLLNYQIHFIKRKDSKEVYLLKNHRWVLLMNEDKIDRSPITHRVNQLGGYYSTRMIEEEFLSLNPEFPIIRQLKEKYIRFNDEYVGKPNSNYAQILKSD